MLNYIHREYRKILIFNTPEGRAGGWNPHIHKQQGRP